MFAAQGGVTPTSTYVDDVFSTYLYTGNSSTQTITNGIDLSGTVNTTNQVTYTTPGTHTWVCPAGVTSVSVVCVGGGGGGSLDGGIDSYGGGGGGLGYKNNYSVTPGTSYTVVVGAGGLDAAGGNSSFASTVCIGWGGAGGTNRTGGSYTGDGGGNGGDGGAHFGGGGIAGGGGAGGYSGTGGSGGSTNGTFGAGAGGGGAGGAGGAVSAYGGGGVGLLGQGSSGSTNGQGGSGGANGITSNATTGGLYGGGGSQSARGGGGAVRIMYPGNTRSFPSTNTTDVTPSGGDSSKGGLVWIKGRSGATDHALYDTARGATLDLATNSTAASTTQASGLTLFNAAGFSLGALGKINTNNAIYASWTFRKAPKFFDVVTYAGNGTTQNIAHSLGNTPGCVIVKLSSSGSAGWLVWHRGLTAGYFIRLDTTSAQSNTTATTIFGNNTVTVDPTSTQFTVGSSGTVNSSGFTYVAYLFAHDTATNGIVQCGSFTTDGSGNATVTLGWEPQFLITKASSTIENWVMFDSLRGLGVGTSDFRLYPNLSNAEDGPADRYSPTATGFSGINLSASQTYIYLAIRRPNKPPTTGTQVFSPIASSAATGTALTTGFPVDMQIGRYRSSSANWCVVDRLRGVSTKSTTEVGLSIATNSSAAEGTYSGSDSSNWGNTGFSMPTNLGGVSGIFYNFRRATGVFDEVFYAGSGTNITKEHNLGVVPEIIIVKNLTGTASDWFVYHSAIGGNGSISLNLTGVPGFSDQSWNNTAPTSTVFSLGTNPGTNGVGKNFVAYLFATRAGISKVFSYTGNGSSQTINCGFTTGARFVLIKRTDSTGDWYVWDSARGIVAGNDPHLSLNSTAAEVTTNDSIDTDSTGFVVNQLAATNINVNTATYIGLAFA